MMTRLLNRLTAKFSRMASGFQTDSGDILHYARVSAAMSSAHYYSQNMLTVPNFPTDLALLQFALQAAQVDDGLICEFGVASGRTINWIAKHAGHRRIHGFDSFEGLPEDWRTGFSEGSFKRIEPPRHAANVDLHIGRFEVTLPPFRAEYSGPLAFLHVDCDLYSSTKTILSHLADRIVPGTIIVFDEYLNYPGWENGEHGAWKEHCAAHGTTYEYLGFVSRHQQVAVRVLTTGEASSSR